MAPRFSYGVAAQPGCAARASAAARRTSAAVALPTRVSVAPVAGSRTSNDPPAALRHSAPNTRPRQVPSIRNFATGAFIPVSLFIFHRSEMIVAIDVIYTALNTRYPGQYSALRLIRGYVPCSDIQQVESLIAEVVQPERNFDGFTPCGCGSGTQGAALCFCAAASPRPNGARSNIAGQKPTAPRKLILRRKWGLADGDLDFALLRFAELLAWRALNSFAVQ